MLLEECTFPQLLRRRNFIDVTTNRLTARRLLKRWFWQRERELAELPATGFSGDLEDLYSTLADRAGTLLVSGAAASRSRREAAQEFEAVLWVPCHGLTLAQAAENWAANSGARPMIGKENCHRIRDLLAARRCLVVLDAPDPEISAALTAADVRRQQSRTKQ